MNAKTFTPKVIGLAVALGASLAYGAKKMLSKELEVVNPDPFDGQLFTVSDKVDDYFYEMAKELNIGKTPKEGTNLLMFGCMCESGLRTLAYNVMENGSYKSHYDKENTYNPAVFAGGLFGLVKKFSPSIILSDARPGSVELNKDFGDWLNSDYATQCAAMRRWLIQWHAQGKINKPLDIRVMGFAPAYLGKPSAQVLYADPSAAYTHQAYLDVAPHDGKITMGEYEGLMNRAWNKHVAYAKAHNGPRQIVVK